MELNEYQFRIIRNIFILRFKGMTYRSKLADELNVSKYSPVFNSTIKKCIELGLMEEHNNIAKIKLLKIDNNKLDSFIRKHSIEFKMWGKFIEVSKPFEYNY